MNLLCFLLYYYPNWTYNVMKVYPGQQVGGFEADLMAANELSAHASLQVFCLTPIFDRMSMLIVYTPSFYNMKCSLL